jgi:hypothetical protein
VAKAQALTDANVLKLKEKAEAAVNEDEARRASALIPRRFSTRCGTSTAASKSAPIVSKREFYAGSIPPISDHPAAIACTRRLAPAICRPMFAAMRLLKKLRRAAGGFAFAIAAWPLPAAEPAKTVSTNALAREKSPYLLQHAHNPVEWYPWGEAAFAKARAENKPIFLSVGYSTCHWCHVMAHESFENGEIAKLMNEHFVNVKVDREERPDVDRVYMTYVQATTGGGGWPMSVFLTPDLQPFFGGTYFPPDDRYGRPGFPTVLKRLAQAWKEDRANVAKAAAEAVAALQEYTNAGGAKSGAAEKSALDAAFSQLARTFDEELGGFGGAPKFPRPVTLNFLFRHYAGSGASLAMAASQPRWRCSPCEKWQPEGCTISSAAASIGTPWIVSGTCRTMKRCSTIKRSWRAHTSRRFRSLARHSMRRSRATFSITSSAI